MQHHSLFHYHFVYSVSPFLFIIRSCKPLHICMHKAGPCIHTVVTVKPAHNVGP